MDMNLVEVANQAIELIKPIVIAGGGKLAEDAAGVAGAKIGEIYRWLKTKLINPKDATALDEATRFPDNEQNWFELRSRLIGLLKEHPDFARELTQLLSNATMEAKQKIKQKGAQNVGVQISGEKNQVNIDRK